MATEQTQFLLLFRNTDLESRLTPPEIEDAMERLDLWLREWSDRGKIKGGQPLGMQGKVVSGAKQRTIADGPFAEAKEVVGGYVLVETGSLEEATRIAEEWPLLDYDSVVEVRPVLEMCPTLLAWRKQQERSVATAASS